MGRIRRMVLHHCFWIEILKSAEMHSFYMYCLFIGSIKEHKMRIAYDVGSIIRIY